jgi:hypothetical protein
MTNFNHHDIYKFNANLKINKIITENVLNLGKDIDIHVQRSFQIPSTQDQKRTSPCHITVKNAKTRKQRKDTETCNRKTPPYMQR